MRVCILAPILTLIATVSLSAQPNQFEKVKAAEGVFVFIPSEAGIGNTTVIVTDDDVIVVDASATPAGARTIIDEIQTLTDKAVRYVVNTHWHDDHVWGN